MPVADLAERYSFDELRDPRAELVLPHVRVRPASYMMRWSTPSWRPAMPALITDMITCPGSISARWRMRDRSSRRKSQKSSRARSGSGQIGDLKIKIRAASMPAAITMSATSAFWAREEGHRAVPRCLGGRRRGRARRSAHSRPSRCVAEEVPAPDDREAGRLYRPGPKRRRDVHHCLSLRISSEAPFKGGPGCMRNAPLHRLQASDAGRTIAADSWRSMA